MSGIATRGEAADMAMDPRSPARPAFLYAHADDLVLGASIAAMRARGSGLDLLLCSAIPSSGDEPTHWDGLCGLGAPADAMTKRLAEHRRASDHLGLTTVCLGGHDGQYGVPESAADRELVIIKAVEAVREWGADCLFTHSSRASHPDHLRAHEVAVVVAAQVVVPVVMTCDRPYEICGALQCPHLAAGADRVSVTATDAEWSRKVEAFGMYASQAGPLHDGFGDASFERPALGRECYTAISIPRPA